MLKMFSKLLSPLIFLFNVINSFSDKNCIVSIDNKCQCSGNLVLQSNEECKLVRLLMSCKNDIDCLGILNAKCSVEKKCICEENFAPVNGKCAPTIGNYCTDQCAFSNSVCIDNKCQCRANYVSWRSRCLPTVLDEPCFVNADCRKIEFSVCKNNKCSCLETFVKFNSTCMKKLGSYCAVDNHCTLPSSVCIDFKCQCNIDYAPVGFEQCVPKKLGEGCHFDEDCRKIPFARCFDNKCQCRVNYIDYDGACLSLLDGFCWDKKQCVTESADCIDYKCQCSTNSTRYLDKCVKEQLDLFCEDHRHCQVINAQCSQEKKCVCKSGQIPVSKIHCAPKLNEYCLLDKPCADVNALCIRNKCSCIPDYIDFEGKCIPRVLRLNCQTDSDCKRVKFSKCIDKKCQCKRNYIEINVETCAALIGEYCIDSIDCYVHNSVCIDRTCSCADKYIRMSGECVSGHLDKECEVDADCFNNSVCSNNNCHCIDNFVAVNATCLPLLHQKCSNGLCVIENSVCIDNQCQCSHQYTTQSNNFCAPVHLKADCQCDSDCALIKNSRCSRRKCVCKENYVPVDGLCWPIEYEGHYIVENFCRQHKDCIDFQNRHCDEHLCVCLPNHLELHGICEPILGGSCSHNKDCFIANSKCIDNKCQCRINYAAEGNRKCIPISLGMECSATRQCTLIKNGICSDENICICTGAYLALDSFTCSALIGELCFSDEDCSILNSHCSDNVCQCNTDFTVVSPGQCAEISSVPECHERSNCGDPLHSDCIQEKCVCKRNHLLVGESCSPLLRGFCWRKGQCYAENSECVNDECQCSPNSVRVANNRCIKKKL